MFAESSLQVFGAGFAAEQVAPGLVGQPVDELDDEADGKDDGDDEAEETLQGELGMIEAAEVVENVGDGRAEGDEGGQEEAGLEEGRGGSDAEYPEEVVGQSEKEKDVKGGV